MMTVSIINDLNQPFCISELRNKYHMPKNARDTFMREEHGDLVIGCDSGILITFNVKRPPNALV
ncbi:MAG: hypothetical protein ACK521_02265 [bacterium]